MSLGSDYITAAIVATTMVRGGLKMSASMRVIDLGNWPRKRRLTDDGICGNRRTKWHCQRQCWNRRCVQINTLL